MKLSNYERETIIRYDQSDTKAVIYTHDPTLIRKLDRFCSETSCVHVEKETEDWKQYVCPSKWIKIQKPRQLSNERREELAARARANFGKS